MRRHREDHGFTLIELLVVLMIIGILAAIALPTFLAQRQRAWDASAKSDVRNLAEFEEMYLTDVGGYGTIAAIQLVEPALFVSKGVTLSVLRYEAQVGYCLTAKHEGSGTTWFYDSQAGGLLPKGTAACPVTVGLPNGDSLTG